MFEQFSDRAREVMALANEEAARMHHEYIGTEHILLALVKEGSGIAATVLRNLDIDFSKMQREIEQLIKCGSDEIAPGKLPQTPRAKKVIEYAIEDARTLNHNYVGTEHLLLGLLRVRDGVAAKALVNFGLDLDKVRSDVLELIGGAHGHPVNEDQLVRRTDHILFWRIFAARFSQGITLIDTLRIADQKLSGTPLQSVINAMIKGIEDGKTLSDTMADHPTTFARSVQMMIKAGEAAGAVEVAAARIVEGIESGAFPISGTPDRPTPVMARLWRAFGLLLGTGVPIIEVANILAEEYAHTVLGKVMAVARQDMMNGLSLTHSLRKFPDIVPLEICIAVDIGEKQGNLDEQALKIADAVLNNTLASLLSQEPQGLTPDEKISPVTKLVDTMIHEAFEARASDIHLDPLPEGGIRVRYRIDGVLHDRDAVPASLTAKILAYVKSRAGMDIAQHRIPQDGRIRIAGLKPFDLRVSLLPTIRGERIVMRIFRPEHAIVRLDAMSLLEDEMETIRRLCGLPHGLIICSGPAGSGKTTLLYAMLQTINDKTVSIVTIEDPVEYVFSDMTQIQVHAPSGLTFARAMKSVMRQDPDVIMVGELRDAETLGCCIQAATTGHLVLTQLHADNAPTSLKRLLDTGTEPYMINSSLAGIIAQRLVRKLCPDCKKPLESLPLHSIPPQAAEFIKKHPPGTFFGPVGCEACNHHGYRGRIPIHEILIPDDNLRQAALANADVATLRKLALQAGMRTLLMCGMEKAARGITSVEEVCRVAGME